MEVRRRVVLEKHPDQQGARRQNTGTAVTAIAAS
jgi:hypothetical protein